MGLTTIKLHNMRQIGKAESQITLDDDYNVPDYRPDILKIIKEQGELKLDEIKPASGAVWIKGKLIFRILYRSDQENGKISCLKGELPFQEKLNMDGVTEYDPVRVAGELEDLTVGVIHSRKLNVRAVVVLKAIAESGEIQEVSDGVEYEEEYMQLQNEVEVSEQIIAKHDICRQKNEISLPSSKPNVREILWRSVELRNIGNRLDKDGLHMTGEVLLSILYQEEEEPDRIQWYETTLPLELVTELGIDHADTDQSIFYKVQIEDVGKELEVKPDYDGEDRMLVLDLQVHLFIRAWQERRLSLLKDVYSLRENLLLSKQKIALERLVVKNDAICKLTEQMELEEHQEKILQICSCEGKAHIDHMKQQEKGLLIEGTLAVYLLYITTDDQMPVGASYQLYPFEQLIELPETKQPVRVEHECHIVQLQASMLDQSHAEIKAAVGVNALVFAQDDLEHISEIKAEAFDLDELQKMPGMVGYVVKKGDTLWNIAKQYHTTVEAILNVNQKKGNELQVGDRLLIIKNV